MKVFHINLINKIYMKITGCSQYLVYDVSNVKIVTNVYIVYIMCVAKGGGREP